MTIFGYNPFTNNLDKSGAGGSGTGNVVGPGSAVTDDIATFADNTGKVIKDSGAKITDFLAVVSNLSDVSNPSTAFDNISPTSAKGDLIVRTASGDVRLPVGQDGNVLIADSTVTEGVKWSPISTLPFIEVSSSSQSMSVNTGYIANNVGIVTLTLPSIADVGDLVWIIGKGSGGWQIAQNLGQIIHLGNQSTSIGVSGHLDSSNQYDTIQLLCITANTEWICTGVVQGNISLT